MSSASGTETAAASSATWAILATDGKRILRDRFLVGMALYILSISVLMRWGIRWFTSEVQARWAFDLIPYYPLVTSYLAVLLGAVLIGIMGGFLMLETREERLIHALVVSPMPMPRYLSVMSAAMIVVASLVGLVQALIIGVGLPPLPQLVATVVLVAPWAPVTALYLASFSDNRVEAFAQAKFIGTAALVVAGSWFVPEPWQWIAGIVPPYWGVKAYWVAEAGGAGWALWLLPGVAVSAF